MTAVVGAVALIVQLTPSNIDQSRFTISGVLIFAALIGSIYLSAISVRYAHLIRYAQGIDDIRRYLITHLNIPTPPIYKPFLSQKDSSQRLRQRSWKFFLWLSWLLPTGTYQLFISAVSSISLGIAIWEFLIAAKVTQVLLARSIVSAFVIFLFTFVIYNGYSHLVMHLMVSRLNIRISTQRDRPILELESSN